MKWTGGTWTADPPNVIANDDGTATVTIISNNQVPVHVALTNTVENALGNFTVTKKATGDFPDLTDPIYATGADPLHLQLHDPGTRPGHRQTFALNQANNFTVTSPGLPDRDEGDRHRGHADRAAAEPVDGLRGLVRNRGHRRSEGRRR